jgi:hypothetical protein
LYQFECSHLHLIQPLLFLILGPVHPQGLEREEVGSDEDVNIQTDTTQQKDAKSPLRIIRKNHPENQIIGDINEGV